MAIGSFSQNGDVPLANKVGREFLRDRGSSPPGSSRRAGGYSPVLRLTADEMSPPLFPCPKKFTFWDTTLLPRGTFWVRVRAGPLADAPRPFSSLLACCTQEEDAGPGRKERRGAGEVWTLFGLHWREDIGTNRPYVFENSGWARGDSNARPLPCQGRALSTTCTDPDCKQRISADYVCGKTAGIERNALDLRDCAGRENFWSGRAWLPSPVSSQQR